MLGWSPYAKSLRCQNIFSTIMTDGNEPIDFQTKSNLTLKKFFKMFVFLTCTEGRAIINVGGLPKGAVCATHIMVVSAQDHWCLQQGRM